MRMPGVLKTFKSGQLVEVVRDDAPVPKGTRGTVAPSGGGWLMMWLTIPCGAKVPSQVQVRNEDVDEVSE
jgi:hypothetical protein